MGQTKGSAKGNFIARVHMLKKKIERSQINDRMLHSKHIEKPAKPKTCRRREIIKIKINKIETKKTIQRINKTKS
jgi:hypothetical protein